MEFFFAVQGAPAQHVHSSSASSGSDDQFERGWALSCFQVPAQPFPITNAISWVVREADEVLAVRHSSIPSDVVNELRSKFAISKPRPRHFDLDDDAVRL